MINALNRTTVLIMLLFGVCSMAWAAETEGSFYKWTDEHGVTHYGDHIPPQYSQQETSKLNQYGLTVGVTSAPRTKEQLEEDARNARIQAEARRQVEEQREKDRMLLLSYITETDIEKARNEKINLIDGVMNVTNNNIALSQHSLQTLQNQAAERERTGVPIPLTLRKTIDETQEMIEQYKSYIEMKRKERSEVIARFNADLQRFRMLKGIQTTDVGSPDQNQASPKNAGANRNAGTQPEGTVTAECNDPSACARAWSLAKSYLDAKASTPLRVVTDTRLATGAPTSPDSVALSVVRTRNPQNPQNQGGACLVLEIHCQDSPAGIQYCATSEVQAIRDGFKKYVEGH